MDLNRLFGQLVRRLMRSATRAGVDMATRRGKPKQDLTPAERKQARSAKALSDKLQKATRLSRRFLR